MAIIRWLRLLWNDSRGRLQDWALDGVTRFWEERICEFMAQPPEVRQAYLRRLDAGGRDGLPEAVHQLMRRCAE